jgi:hypothetical protein
MIDQIKYVKGFADSDLVRRISEYSKTYDDAFTDFGNSEQEFTVHTYHEIESRDSQLLRDMQNLAKSVYNFVLESYGEPFSEFLETKTHIARFKEGAGMHEHYDSSRPNDIATLVYINDDYSGGDIYFPAYNMSFKPEPGDLLCFPDNPNFIHGVRPIISGTRYTTPRWFTRIV